MHLSIIKKPEYDIQFIDWLKGQIQRLYLRCISPRKLKIYAEYINDTICPMTPSLLFRLLTRYITSMRVVEYQFHYSIQSPLRLHYRGIPLETFFNCVEYGSLQIKGNYLLSKVFRHIERNEKRYYKQYLLMYY